MKFAQLPVEATHDYSYQYMWIKICTHGDYTIFYVLLLLGSTAIYWILRWSSFISSSSNILLTKVKNNLCICFNSWQILLKEKKKEKLHGMDKMWFKNKKNLNPKGFIRQYFRWLHKPEPECCRNDEKVFGLWCGGFTFTMGPAAISCPGCY